MVLLKQGDEQRGKMLLTRALKYAHNMLGNHQFVSQVTFCLMPAWHLTPLWWLSDQAGVIWHRAWIHRDSIHTDCIAGQCAVQGACGLLSFDQRPILVCM